MKSKNRDSRRQNSQLSDLFDVALDHQINGRFNEAITSFQQLLVEEPSSAECHSCLGELYIQTGNFEEALPHFQAATKIKPEVEEHCYDLAKLLAWLGEFEQAENLFLTLSPDFAEFNPLEAWLGMLAVETGNHQLALPLLEKAIETEPADLVALYYLGIANHSLDLNKEAQKCFTKMIERFQSFLLINPNFAEGYYFIGIASAHLNNYADAAIHLKRAIELDTPEIDYHSSHGLSYHDFDAHMAYADILIKLDRKTEAIEQIEKALLIRPKDQRALSIKKRL